MNPGGDITTHPACLGRLVDKNPVYFSLLPTLFLPSFSYSLNFVTFKVHPDPHIQSVSTQLPFHLLLTSCYQTLPSVINAVLAFRTIAKSLSASRGMTRRLPSPRMGFDRG